MLWLGTWGRVGLPTVTKLYFYLAIYKKQTNFIVCMIFVGGLSVVFVHNNLRLADKLAEIDFSQPTIERANDQSKNESSADEA